MAKIVECEYTGTETLTPDQIRLALSGDYEGFKYYFENCLLIQDRDTRQFIHPKLNEGQKMIAKMVMSLVDKNTRADSHKECLFIGPRQFGKSTLLTALSNYIVAYVPGFENLNCVHTMHQATAAAKFFKQKMAPIITNVPFAIYPTIERDTMGTSTLLKYKDIKGIRRGGYYEITSAGSNSVRSGTVSLWLCDEPSEYRNPEAVEDAVSGAISSYGWSLTAYIGTFSDRLSDYFLNKIKLALDNPDEIELVFIPWFLVYGRDGDGLGFTEDQLTEYDKEVIIPEMQKWGIPRGEWFNKLGWYHTRSLRTSKMRYEFPSSIDDIITMTSDRMVFSEDSLKKQEANIRAGKPYRIVTDNATGKVEAQETDISPFTIFKEPVYGRQYMIAIDPITAQSADTDYFTMQVMDTNTNEQVAIFRDRGLQDEDYADWAVSIGTIYNKAQLCPEINVANGFIVSVNSKRYYRWWYAGKKEQADKTPGLRTTVSTKEKFIDALTTLIDRENIIIHDQTTLDELRNFVRKVKTRADGTQSIRMCAKGKSHDDCHAKGTLILTDKGEVPIEKIRVGDRVLTRDGYRKVVCTSKRVKGCIDKYGLSWSPDHPIITDSGDVKLQDIDIHDTIYTWKQRIPLSTKEKNTTDTQIQKEDICKSTIGTMVNGKNHQYRYIHRFGKTIMGKFLKGTSSIIKTATHKTITCLTLNVLRRNNMLRYITQTLNGQIVLEKSCPKRLEIDQYGCIDVSAVAKNSNLRGKLMLGFVQSCVRAGIMPRWARTYTNTKGHVNVAINLSRLIMGAGDYATNVLQREKTLYAITVDGKHEYFADGILVKNTVMSLAIYAGTRNLRQLQGRKRTEGISLIW